MVSRDLQDQPARGDCPVAKDIQVLMDVQELQGPKERLVSTEQRAPVEWMVVVVPVELLVYQDLKDSKVHVEHLERMETLVWTGIQDHVVNKANQERRATKDALERLVFVDRRDLVDYQEAKESMETGEMMVNPDPWEPLERSDWKDTVASSVSVVPLETLVRQEK